MDCLGNQLSPLDGSLYYASVPQTSFGRAMVGTKRDSCRATLFSMVLLHSSGSAPATIAGLGTEGRSEKSMKTDRMPLTTGSSGQLVEHFITQGGHTIPCRYSKNHRGELPFRRFIASPSRDRQHTSGFLSARFCTPSIRTWIHRTLLRTRPSYSSFVLVLLRALESRNPVTSDISFQALLSQQTSPRYRNS